MTCIFCENRPETLFENELAVAFYDNFPVSPGHTLIIPKRHMASYFELTAAERTAIQALLEQAKRSLDEKFSPTGYNVGVNVGEDAGQSVFHCHIHLIPRYHGDVESPKGGVRGVIPDKQKY